MTAENKIFGSTTLNLYNHKVMDHADIAAIGEVFLFLRD